MINIYMKDISDDCIKKNYKDIIILIHKILEEIEYEVFENVLLWNIYDLGKIKRDKKRSSL